MSTSLWSVSRWARGITTVVAVLGLLTAGGVAAAQGSEHAAHAGGHSGGGAHAGAAHGGRSAAPAGHYAPRGGYAPRGAAHYTSPRAGGASGYHGAPGGRYYAGAGGWHGGGWHGSGWHGTGGYWHGHWWGGVYPLGVFFAALPLGYATYWWNGIPYYYANSTFYQWNIGAGQYETVAPPGEDPSGAGPAAGGELYVYPQQGQSDEQQRQDRYECYQWAAGQTGFDPTQPNGGVSGADNAAAGDAYRRAEGACLEGRGYTVR